ncbi:MAG: hypothetical protein IJH63_00900 [Methanobrevibacter sp.]|nr:hypothetical protein [Methanosphaera sp.]MBR0369263.1 hypothetical protein [Methanobrevibacter sp.]
MEDREFMEKAVDMVLTAYNELVEITDNYTLTEDDVYIVWMCSILGNNKALLSTTVPDGMYYEVTFNNTNNELYLDGYKKLIHKKYEL